ncbi:MAG TPA: MlaD family protein [Thermoanaerobaculia bacterium]|nr:MlaD family protein [Thermoanaerobaculia bacterium]
MANAVKVGIFMTVCLIALAIFVLRVEDLSLFGDEPARLAAQFRDVSGLDDQAAVRVAGVRVGRVDGITLAGRQARVELLLDEPLALTVGSRARIANMGLLGDKYVELIPGPAGAPALPPDAVLPGETPVTFDEALAKLNRLGDSIQGLTGSFAGQDLGAAVNRLLVDVQATSAEIRLLVAANQAQIASAVRNLESFSGTLARELPRLTAEMQRAVGQIAGLVAENRQDIGASVDNVRELTARLQTSVDNLNEITGRVARGEGTLGKLVSDPTAHDELVATLDSIQGGVETLSGALGTIQKFQVDVGMEGFYLQDVEETQSAFRLDIGPKDEPRMYRVGIANTPRGDTKSKTQRITVTKPDGTSETTTVETLTQEDERVITALFGYRGRNDVNLWAGLIEDSGGAQVEYPLFDRRLWLSLEAFDFNREDLDPHLRLSTRWLFHPNLYLMGGYDDFLEDDSFFLGGGIRWRDDYLKYLLGSAPIR